MINFTNYTDPDYGVLLPTALTLPALGLSDHGLRKFRPLLVEGVDFLKQPGQGSIERIFYSAAGLLKLANAAATPQAKELIAALQPYLPKVTPPLPAPVRAAIVPAAPQAVQPCTVSPSDLDPYAPMQRDLSIQPSPFPRPVEAVPLMRHTAPPSVTPSYTATENHSDPAAQIASQLAPHLAPAIAAQVGSQVTAALFRLENRPKELTEAELLLEQQRISIEQFKAVQEMVIAAQESSADQTRSLLGAMPKPNVFIESNGFQDLIALMLSPGMQLLAGMGCLTIAAILLFSGRPAPPPAPAPLYQAPTSPAPIAPIPPATPVPLAPAPYTPTTP